MPVISVTDLELPSYLPSLSCPVTLLELAVRRPTVVEHALEVLLVPGSSCRARTVVCLADSVELTPFQQQVESLRLCLPDYAGLSSHTDWLDADLSALVKDNRLPVPLRMRIQEIKTLWHYPPVQEDLLAIHLYTDGSAQGDDHSGFVQDCSWAFCAWAVFASEERYIGHAAHCSVPCDTPFFLGEADSEAVRGRLTLCWMFAWIVDSGRRYNVPIVACYDCTTAGMGAFAASRTQSRPHPATSFSLTDSLTYLRQCAQIVAHIVPRHVRAHASIFKKGFGRCSG